MFLVEDSFTKFLDAIYDAHVCTDQHLNCISNYNEFFEFWFPKFVYFNTWIFVFKNELTILIHELAFQNVQSTVYGN